MPDVAPGWYSDPTDPLQERLWDGSEWIDKVRPKAPTTLATPRHDVIASAQQVGLDLSSKSSQTRRISGVTITLIVLAILAVMGTLAAVAVPAYNAAVNNSSTGEVYAVGDVGPGGGRVFITPATAGNTTGLYFEAAPFADEVEDVWCSDIDTLLGASGTAIGTGAANTATAAAFCSSGAIHIASNYSNNGFSDWFLPSQDELNELYLNKELVGGFSSDYYWSSSELGAYDAWFQLFFSGGQSNGLKNFTFYVRPVRAFN